MIKHIVIFRITGNYDKETRRRLAYELAACFSPLKEHSSVTEYKTGVNFNESENAWDVVIDSLFESRAKLEEYQVSIEHQQAIKSAARFNKEKAVVDYELH